MEDDFKLYKEEPAAKFGRRSFSMLEVILAIVAGVLFILWLVFVGLFASRDQELAEKSRLSAANGNGYCTNVGCLKMAARAASCINRSVDPCENFYKFACGNYKKVRQDFGKKGFSSGSVFNEISDRNRNRLEDILRQPVSAESDHAEKRLKQVFSSCTDFYSREQAKGKPLQTRVFPQMGGWKVLGTWNPDTWDLNAILKHVQGDFLVPVFFTATVDLDNDKESRIISLKPPRVGKHLNTFWYTSTRYEDQLNKHKDFIKEVGSLIVRDISPQLDLGTPSSVDDLLDEFVNDTYTMENMMANLVSAGNKVTLDRVSLEDLTARTQSVIDYGSQLSYLFTAAGVSGRTTVKVIHETFFKDLSTQLLSLPPEDMKRIVHNYYIWRVVESFLQHLSDEYSIVVRHAERYLYGRSFSDNFYDKCFNLLKTHMTDALNHLYITQFLPKENRDAAHNITHNIRSALRSQLSKTPWMDDATRKYAQDKVDRVKINVGYPEWMASQNQIDAMYGTLVALDGNHFHNVLELLQLERLTLNNELQGKEAEHEGWPLALFDCVIKDNSNWNEVAINAGMLQYPMYDATQPYYTNFGGLGVEIGKILPKLVDYYGSLYDKDGKRLISNNRFVSFWSDSTISKFKAVEQCVEDVYSNVEVPVIQPDGSTKSVKLEGHVSTGMAIHRTNGMRLALTAYQAWMKDTGSTEKMVPELDMTNRQMLFLAHAQSQCKVRSDESARKDYSDGSHTEETLLNTAMAELEEFADAFQCKQGARMNHKKRCQYF